MMCLFHGALASADIGARIQGAITTGLSNSGALPMDEVLNSASLILQICVASYALWLNRVFGTRRAGWALSGAFVLMLAMHLNEAVFPPVTVALLSLKPQVAYSFISLLLLIGLSHLASVYRERQKMEASLTRHRDELEIRVKERTRDLAAEIEQRKQAEAEIRASLAERERMAAEVEKSHNELLVASRQAGMAEVATSVLHNIGNVVNSVNVSTQTVEEAVKRLPVSSLSRVSALIREHASEPGLFFLEHPKGRQIPAYLEKVGESVSAEQRRILDEIGTLRKHVEHVREIIVMQQRYAGLSAVRESVNLLDLLEDALQLGMGAFDHSGIVITREYEAGISTLFVEKHKLLQLLVNLIRNAKHACRDSARPDQAIALRVSQHEETIQISVTDNGVGITPENRKLIFTHGFTTRKYGHGFGLHWSALAAEQLGGSLAATSEGAGLGAQFTLCLPLVTDSDQADRTVAPEKGEAVEALEPVTAAG